MQVEGTEYHRVKTVAARLDVSPVTIYRAIKSGKLRAAKFGEGRDALRVTGAALAEYVAACETATAGQPTTDQVWANLSPAQADGVACVTCGAEFLASAEAQWLVGRSVTGSQVFACVSHATTSRDELGEVA